jgi:methyl-accepting chemotaxis protein
MSRLRSRVRFDRLSLATRVAMLCVGLSALLAVGLTALGYVKAREGLARQAEATIGADARAVASAVDAWHQARTDSLISLARLQSARRTLLAETPDPRDADDVLDAVRAVDATENVLDSVALINGQGRDALDSDPKGQGTDLSFRDYVQAPMKGQAAFISSVTVSVVTNQAVLFHSVPVKGEDGKTIGVVRSRAALSDVTRLVESAQGRAGDGAIGLLLDENGLVIATTMSPDWVGRPVVALTPDASAALNKAKRWVAAPEPAALDEADLGVAVGTTAPRSFGWSTGGVAYHALAVPLQATRWTYVTALPVATFEGAANEFLRVAVLAALTGLAVICLVVVLFARKISRAVGRISELSASLARRDLPMLVSVVSRVARGDLSGEVTVNAEHVTIDSADELGRMAVDFNSMVDGLHETGAALSEMTASLRQMMAGVQSAADDVAGTSRTLSVATGETASVVQQVAQAVTLLAAGSANTAQSSHVSKSAVAELACAIDEIASTAQAQSRQMQQAAETAAEMATGIEQVAASSQTVAAASVQTRASAEHGAQAVRETVSGMRQIKAVVTDASAKVGALGRLGDQIGAMVETIDDIADQTNLLALNAAIEAARAGEHGRGFAVVAGEVGKLAERSRRETKAIADVIGQIQAGTSDAVKAMEDGALEVEHGALVADRAGVALGEILTAVEATVGQVSGIAAAAQQVSTGARTVIGTMMSITRSVDESSAAIEQMAVQAGQVTATIQTIATVSAESSASTEEVSAAAEEMSAQVDQMSSQATDLAATADELMGLMSRFHVDDDGSVAASDDGSSAALASRRRAQDWRPGGRHVSAARRAS